MKKQFTTKNELTGTKEVLTFNKVVKIDKIPWYIQILLYFRPLKTGSDFGDGEKTGMIVGYKELFNKIYILAEFKLPKDIQDLIRSYDEE